MARKMFGGKLVHFGDAMDTLKDVFGTKPISPAEMNKKLWDYIKKKGIFK